MKESFQNTFQKTKYEPSEELKDKIWNRIVLKDRRIAYFKIGSFSVLSLASLLGLVPVFKTLISDFTKSGFYEYLSLAFSNNGFFSSYWKEFVYSLAESIPTMSIVFSLALLFIFFLSLYFILKQIINNIPVGKTYRVA